MRNRCLFSSNLGLWIAAHIFALGCSTSSEDPPAIPNAPTDTTYALRQRLAYYEGVRSYGADTVPNAARHPDPVVRRAAAMALGRIQTADGLDHLLPLLEDPDRTVVLQAAWAMRQLRGLSESQKHRLQSALTLHLELETIDDLWPFLEALRPHAGPASLEPISKWIAAGLLAGMGSEARPPLVEGMAALVLGELNTERSIRTLASMGPLSNRAEPAAWRIAAAMSLHPDSTYLGSLRPLTSHPHPYARAAGARALGQHKDRAGIEHLYQLLADFDWEVRASALRGLSDLGDESARSYCAAMTGDAHALVREAALLALEKLGAGNQTDLVAEALADPVPAVRLTALRVIADALGAGARSQWETARADSIDFVRSHALESTFDVMDADAATTYLLEALRNDAVRERSAAVSAVAASADAIPVGRRDDVRVALETALADEDFVVASLAANALGELGEPSAIAALVDAYRRNDTGHNAVDIRWSAVGALVEMATTQENSARSGLESFFESASTDPDVRIAHDAQRGLAQLRGQDEPEPPAPRLQPAGADPATWPRIDLGRVRVRLVTRHGEAILELDGDDYPRTVGSFLKNVDDGFYADAVFHRVVPAFVVQGGCPRGDGWGDAGVFLPCEYGDLRYDREGVVGMAHAGRDTGGSQFFITHLPVPRLDGRYTAFGRVIEGMDVVDQVLRGDRFRIERMPMTMP